MARAVQVKNYNDFSKGLITESNELAPVANALKDMLNVEIVKTGGLRKRFGIDREDGASSYTVADATGISDQWGTQVYEWKGAGGDPTANITVVQRGTWVGFYLKGVTDVLSDNLLGSINLTTFAPNFGGTTANERLSFTSSQGILFMAGRHINTQAVTYDVGSGALDYFYYSIGEIQTRKFIPLDDSLAIDAQPTWPTMTLSGVAGGPPTPGTYEVMQGATSGATALYLTHVSATVFYVDVITTSPAFQVGETVNFLTSGASGTYVSDTGNISKAHRWNLFNQGWTTDTMRLWGASYKTVPSNTQVWFEGKDSSGSFSPAVLNEVSFGITPAPRGHYTQDEFNATVPDPEDVGASFVPASIKTDIDNRPKEVAAFAGRLWYAGVESTEVGNNIYFTQVLDPIDISTSGSADFSQIRKCYQAADPTSEIDNELAANDGGVIRVAEMDNAVRLVPLKIGMLVFAYNGIWFITGSDPTTGFAANAYSIPKISDTGTDCPDSVVVVGDVVYFWNEQSIYRLKPGNVPGEFSVEDIGTETILSNYQAIPLIGKQNAWGYFDEFNKKIVWTYDDIADYGKQRTNLMYFDLTRQAFYPFTMAQIDATAKNSPWFTGMTQDRSFPDSDGTVPIKFSVGLVTGTPAHSISFAELWDKTNLKDWYTYDTAGAYYSVYWESWADTLDDEERIKQTPYVFCYFKRTEDGFSTSGGGLVADNPSSCLMRAKWDWHNTATGGRWSGQREVYKYRRLYVPVDASDTYDTGQAILMSRNMVRGKGQAVSLRWDVPDGYQSWMLGYSIPYTTTTKP